MPLYLSRFRYIPETWARLIANPEDRRQAAESYIESVGGKLHGFWYAFGTHDGYNLWEAPDNIFHGCGFAGDRWRRSAELVGDDSPAERRRDHGGHAQGWGSPVPRAWHVAGNALLAQPNRSGWTAGVRRGSRIRGRLPSPSGREVQTTFA